MVACTRPLIPVLTACALLLPPSTSSSESVLVSLEKSSTELELRIIIPQFIRVLENSHPVVLDADADGDWSAQQRLVVVSNMKRGFCVTLRMSAPEVDAWRLHTPQSGGITLDAMHDGWGNADHSASAGTAGACVNCPRFGFRRVDGGMPKRA